jgi:hypothetical protein
MINPKGLSGSVNLTLPLATLMGWADSPGELGAFGPVTGHSAREIALGTLASPAVRWCVTLTGTEDQAVGHGCASRKPTSRAQASPGQASSVQANSGKASSVQAGPGQASRGRVTSREQQVAMGPAAGGQVSAEDTAADNIDGWTFTVRISALAQGKCEHERESAGYQPSPLLRHLIEIRNQRCTYPGCRQPAARCDKDHTIPFDQGGRTCECNIGPLCRHHHKMKQSQGWRLEQPAPGILAWVTPAGWEYITGPDAYPT